MCADLGCDIHNISALAVSHTNAVVARTVRLIPVAVKVEGTWLSRVLVKTYLILW